MQPKRLQAGGKETKPRASLEPTPYIACLALPCRCVAAEPHHGERWQRVAKNPANAHQSTEVLLKKVAVELDKELAA
jgi:hypothetical protein